ncbi:hypothetical protein CORC01_13680, partial [Colletotrichum orchidophilum]
ITVGQSLARFTNCRTRKDCETLDESRGSTQVSVDDKLQCHASVRPLVHCILAHAPKSSSAWRTREHLSLSTGDNTPSYQLRQAMRISASPLAPHVQAPSWLCKRLKSDLHHHTALPI